MNISKIIIFTFILIFCFNNKVAYSQSFENNESNYKIKKNSFFEEQNNFKSLAIRKNENSEKELNNFKNIKNMTLFFPGLGQLILQDYLKGIVFMTLGIGLIGTMFYGFSTGNIWGILVFSLASILPLNLLYITSAIDLDFLYKNKLREANSTHISPKQEKTEKAFLMNLYLPGLGSFYSGDILRGILYFSSILGVSIYSLSKFGRSDAFMFFVLIPAIYYVSMIDSSVKYSLDSRDLEEYDISSIKINNNDTISYDKKDTVTNIGLLSYNFKF